VVPVLLVTGPVGVGKSAVLHEAGELLIRAEIPHATVVLEEIARCWPAGTHEPPAEPIAYRNLALLWPNFAAQGAQRLLLEQIVEHAAQLRQLRGALPTSTIQVVRLTAPLSLIEERLRAREPYPGGERCGLLVDPSDGSGRCRGPCGGKRPAFLARSCDTSASGSSVVAVTYRLGHHEPVGTETPRAVFGSDRR
jgi:hypothetical protein